MRLSNFEVTPDDIRRSAKNVQRSVSDIPNNILRDVTQDVEYGNDEVANAMDGLCEALVSAVDILRDTAEEADVALRGIAAEYEGHDMKQSKELGSVEFGAGRLDYGPE